MELRHPDISEAMLPEAEVRSGRQGSPSTERKVMPLNRLAHPSPVPAARVPVKGHDLERALG